MNDADTVRDYLRLAAAGDEAGAAPYRHEDFRYWVSGRLIVSGDLTLDQARKAAAGVHDTFPDGYTLHIRNVVVDGAQVVVEAQGEGKLADGTLYTPRYAMFFELRDGRIAEVREYIDTEYVAATFKLPVRGG